MVPSKIVMVLNMRSSAKKSVPDTKMSSSEDNIGKDLGLVLTDELMKVDLVQSEGEKVGRETVTMTDDPEPVLEVGGQVQRPGRPAKEEYYVTSEDCWIST